MTLHLSQIGLTLGLTFTALALLRRDVAMELTELQLLAECMTQSGIQRNLDLESSRARSSRRVCNTQPDRYCDAIRLPYL
jgi:hypothetical protein